MKKALFLDRDGIINVDTGYTWRVEDFVFTPHIFALCKQAKALGYLLIVITNQSGIARGMYRVTDVDRLHAHMKVGFAQQQIQLDAVYYCPHHPDFTGACLCRKPGSLLLEKAIAKFQIDPNCSFMIGDKESDVLAGIAAGCKSIRVHPKQIETQAMYRVPHLGEIIGLLSFNC